MSKVESTQLLQHAQKDAQKIISTFENEFLTLSIKETTWQAAPNQWSVLQCLEHLNLVSKHYITEMQKKVDGAIEQGITSNQYFKRGFIGKRMTKSMKPKENGAIPNPVQTFKNFNPINLPPIEDVQAVLDQFAQDQQVFLEVLEKAAMVDLNKVKITSLLRFLKLKLGDAIEFYLAHEARHMLQAQRVLEARAFVIRRE